MALEQKDFETAASIALYYYDRAYEKGIAMKQTKEVKRIAFENDDYNAIAKTLIKQFDT